MYKQIESSKYEIRKKIAKFLLEQFNYTDDNNPFGDQELSKPFIWEEKINKLTKKGLNPYINGEDIIDKFDSIKTEISKLKQVKEDKKDKREITNEIKSKEEYTKNEKRFHINQETIRREIRLKEGKEQPFDVLFKILLFYDGKIDAPSNYFENEMYSKPYLLYDMFIDNIQELKNLHFEILKQISIEKETCYSNEDVIIQEKHINYWSALVVLLESYIYPDKCIDNLELETREKIENILKDKNIKDLEDLEGNVESFINQQTSSNDLFFWESVHYQIKRKRSFIILSELYNHSLSTLKLEQSIKNSQNTITITNKTLYESNDNSPKKHTTITNNTSIQEDKVNNVYSNKIKLENSINNKQSKKETSNQHNSLLEPIMRISKESNHENSSEDEEVNKFLNNKKKNKEKTNVSSNLVDHSNIRFLATFNKTKVIIHDNEEHNLTKQMKDMLSQELDGDETLCNMINNDISIQLVENEFKPRKPKYFNRVKTGYEWNKYYQKHYSYDDPPPKVIQGYKYHIFYPCLMNMNKTPEYIIEKSDIKDTCNIRFSAGQPYEDISFNIINREWDMNEKSFKNVFENGILFLYFNFKRFRYKR